MDGPPLEQSETGRPWILEGNQEQISHQAPTAVTVTIPNLSVADFLSPRAKLLELGHDVVKSAMPESLVLLSRASDPTQFSDVFMFDGQGRVAISVTASDLPQVETALKELGFETSASVPAYNLLEGYLPVGSIGMVEALSSDGLLGVMVVPPPVVNVGNVTSQADFFQETDRVRATAGGPDGTGVTVGVLSDSYNSLGGASAGVASGDLPSGVNVLADSSGTDEGRGMLELIHDLAPGASLAFATANGGEATFAQNIRDLADPSQGNCDVIVDDISYFLEPFFQDGLVAEAVNDVVTNDGVTYFSSAGNLSNASYETTTINFSYQTISGLGAGYFFDFNPGSGVDTKQSITLDNNEAFYPVLQWDDPYYSSSIDADLDVYLMYGTSVVAYSNYSNVSIQRPIELFSSPYYNTSGSTRTYDLVFHRYSTSSPGRLKYVDFGQSDIVIEYDTNSGTMNPHAGAANAIAVAAAFYGDQDQAESFTSHGPTTILFDSDGTRKASAEVRQKPDLTAIDGTDTTFFGSSDSEGNGFPNFFGTSAAAPHAAAVAALMLDANPGLTPAQIATAMKNTARDLGTSGFDTITGAGLVDAFEAIYGAPTPVTLPFSDGFDSAALATAWETNSTGPGLVQTMTSLSPQSGSRHVGLGSYDVLGTGTGSWGYSRNEMTLHVDTTGMSAVTLSFYHKETNDNDHPMSATFTDYENSDGVAFSVDGVTWYRIITLTGANSTSSYQQRNYNLSDLATTAGVALGADVRVRFQQYGFYPFSNDGILFDSISVSGTTGDTDAPEVAAVTVSDLLITDSDAASVFLVTVDFDEDMDESVEPTVVFGSAEAYSTLTLNSVQSRWTDADTYQAWYTVQDANVTADNVTIDVTGAEDLAGNPQENYTPQNEFDIDTQNPIVSSVTVNDLLITDADAATVFLVTVDFNEDMDESVEPTVVFSSPAAYSTLTFNSVQSRWTDANSYQAWYTVQDANVTADDVTIDVTGAEDLAGNAQQNYAPQNEFDIDTQNPIVSSVSVNDVLITDADVATVFLVTVDFNEDMDESVEPTVVFGSPAAYSTLTFNSVQSRWTDANSYQAWYTVQDANVTADDVTIDVTGAEDLAGNAQQNYAPQNEFDIDTAAPAAPVVTDPAAAVTLNADTYAIAGSAEANSLVKIYVDANNNNQVDAGETLAGEQQLSGGGTAFSISVSLTQDAINNFVVTASDAAANVSPATDVPAITEDSQAPAAPVVTDPAAAVTLNADTYAIAGTAEANSLVKIYVDANNNNQVDAGETLAGEQQLSGGGTAFSISVSLTQDAINNFVVTASDAAANVSPATDVPAITEDSQAPAAPMVTDPAAAVTLNADTYAILGTAEADSLVKVYVDANDNNQVDAGETLAGQQQLTGGGTAYSISVSLTQDAANNFVVTATDAADNVSAATGVPAITEDSQTPAAPVVTDPAAAVTLNADTYTILGTAEADSLVKVYVDANNNNQVDAGETLAGQQQLSGGGTGFSISVSLTPDAVNNFVVTTTDAVANVSPAADVPAITEDSQTPTAPVVTDPAAAVTLNADTYAILGTAEADSLVKVYVDANDNNQVDAGETLAGQQQLSGGGTAFSISVSLTQDAVNNFVVTATDAADNVSAATDVPAITEDSQAPAAPVVSDPAAAVTLNADTYAIAGTAEADSLVKVYVDANNNNQVDAGETLAGQQQLSGGGTGFSISVSLTPDAVNNFVVTTTDAVANVSPAADVPAITEDSQTPTAPVVTDPAAAVTLNADTYAILGTAEADSLVKVYVDANDNNQVDAGETLAGQQQLSGGGTAFSISVSLTQDAVNNFVVTATDAADNVSAATDVPAITEDSQAPAAPVVSDPAAAVTLNADTYAIAGTAEADSLVKVYVDANNNNQVDAGETLAGQQQLSGGGTAFSISVSLTQDAIKNFVVTATDAAANVSPATDVPAITEDSQTPAAPVVTDPASAVTLNAATYAIAGTAEADSLVKIYVDANNNNQVDGGETLAGQQQLSGGATSFSINVALTPDAVNNFVVTATDAASNVSSATDVPAITEDSQTPAAPVVTDPASAVTLNADTYAIAGTAEADSLVRVYIDANDNNQVDGGETLAGQQQLSGGATSFSINVALTPDAVNNFVVTASDAASNVSSATDVPAITEDSQTPAAPVVTDPASAVTLNADTYAIAGTAEADSLVRVYIDANDNNQVDGGETLAGQQQLSGGATSFSINVSLTPDAVNNFVVTASDAASNVSAATDVPAITEDSQTPAAPVVTDPASAVTLNAATYAIAGTAEADSLVKIYVDANNNNQVDGGETLAGQQQLSGGATSFSINVSLTPDAVNNFVVTASDAASNVSSATDVPAITEDSQTPAAPVVTDPASAVTLNAATYAIAGTAEADSLVKIYVDANGNNQVDGGETLAGQQQLSGGATSFSISVSLTQDAVNNFVVTATDAAANVSPAADVPAITEDSQTPAAPVVTDPASAVTLNAATYAIAGTADADSLVKIYVDANSNNQVDGGETLAGQQQLSGGATSFSISVSLTPDAVNNFVVTASDAASNVSLATDVPAITEDSQAPAAAVVTDPASAVTLNAATYAIAGTADADSLVRVYIDANDNNQVDGGETLAGQQQLSGGATSFSINVALTPDAVNNFVVTASDAASNVSPATDVPAITEDSQTPAAPVLSDPGSAVTLNAATYAIAGTAEADSLVRVYIDANDNNQVDAGETLAGQQQLSGGATSFSISVSLAPDAVNNFVVTATDAAAHVSPAADVPALTEDSQAPTVTAVSIGGNAIAEGQKLGREVPEITVTFSEEVSTAGGATDPDSVTNPANWTLTNDSVDITARITGITFGINAATSAYEATITLDEPLESAAYVLTANGTTSIEDMAGNRLDGDADGMPGGDFARSFTVAAPSAELNWTTTITGIYGQSGNAITHDSDGNVYVTGYFGDTVDFDPGAGVFELTSFGEGDVFIAKYSAAGELIWAEQVGGLGQDEGKDIALDSSGNVYVTGRFRYTVDFDPSESTFELTSPDNIDAFVLKLDNSGDFVWAKAFTGSGYNMGIGIAVDEVGNVYTTGQVNLTADFDPGPGVFELTSHGASGHTDAFISRP